MAQCMGPCEGSYQSVNFLDVAPRPFKISPMAIFLIRVAIYIGTAAIGLLVASWILPDFVLTANGFLVAVVVFAVVQTVLSRVGSWTVSKLAPLAAGGVGLISTFVALFVAQIFPEGLGIHGLKTWILAPLVVWIITTLGAWLLPLIFMKKRLAAKK